MDRAAIDRIARDIHERWNKPGLAVTVVRHKSPTSADRTSGIGNQLNEQNSWEEEIFTYGQANKAGRQWDKDASSGEDDETKTDRQTLFSVASTSKHFTTIALGCLIEDGQTLPDGQKLKWSTRVKDVFPNWAPPDKTIREQCMLIDLGSMRSGMPGHDRGIGDIETEAIFDLLPHLRPSAGLRQTYQYCNFGINLLAHVIPTLLNGKPFDEYLRERVLNKLGMNDTVPSRDQVLGELSARYADGWQHELDVPLAYSAWEKVKDGKGTFEHGSRMPEEMFGTKRAYRFLTRSKRYGPGAGHVITTPADMAKWMKGVLSASDSSPIPAKVVKAITKPRMASAPSGRPGPADVGFTSYALGLEVFTYRGVTTWSHAGDMPGNSTLTVYFPDYKIGICGMMNVDDYGTGLVKAVVYSIVDEVLGLGPIAESLPRTDKGGWERRILGDWIDWLGKPDEDLEPGADGDTSEQSEDYDICGKYEDLGYGTLDFKPIQTVPELYDILPRIRKQSKSALPEDEDEIFVSWHDKWVRNWIIVTRLRGRTWRWISLGVYDQVGWHDGEPDKDGADEPEAERDNCGKVVWGWLAGKAVFTDDKGGKRGVGFFDFDRHGLLDEPVEPTEVDTDTIADVWFKKL